MKIYFFTPGNRRLGSARARVYIVSDHLNNMGVSSEVFQVKMRPVWKLSRDRMKEFLRNIKILYSINKKDVAYLQKTISQTDFILLILFFKIFLGKNYFFDYDDAIFLYSSRIKFKTNLLLKHAKGVITSSHYLYEYALKLNQNCLLIPTCVNTIIYKPIDKSDDKIIIGWSGLAAAHYENLKILEPVFKNLIEDNINFKFILCGLEEKDSGVKAFFQNIKGLNVEFTNTNWKDASSIARVIQKFDIGVMPLVENEWNRGKAAFKAIEYMACGVPVVISPTGEGKYVVKNGLNGFLAGNKEEWVLNLKKLIADKKLRGQIGLRGREAVEKKYSYEANIPKLLSFLTDRGAA